MERVKMLKVSEVAARLGVSTSAIYSLVQSGSIPSVRVGKAWRIPESELDRYVKSQSCGMQE